MIPGKVHSVIFDFDYTLGDSSPGIIESVNYALSRLGLPQASPEAIRRTLGLSLTETFKALTGPEQAHLGDAFQDHFVVRADEVMADSTKLFDFVPATVRTLSDRGLKLGIVSSKYRRRIEGVLEREGLREHFAVIVGAEDVAAFKPDPAGLISAAEKLSTSPANVLYVGAALPTPRPPDVPRCRLWQSSLALRSGTSSPITQSAMCAAALANDRRFFPAC